LCTENGKAAGISVTFSPGELGTELGCSSAELTREAAALGGEWDPLQTSEAGAGLTALTGARASPSDVCPSSSQRSSHQL